VRSVRLEWDEPKNAINLRQHGLSFEEASELFTSGTDYLEVFDAEHSDAEDRFLCIGPIRRGVILVVKTEPAEDCVQIISARKATKSEAALFAAHATGLKR